MTSPKEVIAKAIFTVQTDPRIAISSDPDVVFGGAALAVLSELDRAGYAVVPKEPTPTMLKLEGVFLGGWGAFDDAYACDPEQIWTAMLAAAREDTK